MYVCIFVSVHANAHGYTRSWTWWRESCTNNSLFPLRQKKIPNEQLMLISQSQRKPWRHTPPSSHPVLGVKCSLTFYTWQNMNRLRFTHNNYEKFCLTVRKTRFDHLTDSCLHKPRHYVSNISLIFNKIHQ